MESSAIYKDVKPPCTKGCERRSVTCHGTCEDYLKFLKKNEQMRLKRHMEGIRNAAKSVYGKG